MIEKIEDFNLLSKNITGNIAFNELGNLGIIVGPDKE